MDDRTLLEKAAKAAGIQIAGWCCEHDVFQLLGDGEDGSGCWNPLIDDGDALRLAVTLGISVRVGKKVVSCICGLRSLSKERVMFSDPIFATRRAIVRAAATLADKGE